MRFGWRDHDTFTGRWTAPDPMDDAGGDDDWYGYRLDDPVNGVDPLGLETRGIGGGASIAGVGLLGGLSAMVSEDDNGERVIEFSTEYGTSNDMGIGVTGTYQKTDAMSVDQLKGKSSKVGGEIAVPTPIGSVGSGMDHISGSDYSGINHNLSWSPNIGSYKMPLKLVKGGIKHEQTWTTKVPKIRREYAPDLW